MSRRRYNFDEEELIRVSGECISMMEASQKMKMPYSTFIRHAKILGVYKPNQGLKGSRVPVNRTTKEKFLNEILIEQSSWNGKGQRVKKFLIEFGLKEDKCEVCGADNIWNDQPIVLQLDHINGIKDDNRLVNLRIICPNCHSQKPTFSSRKLS